MAGDCSEHDAHTRKLYRYITEAIRRVDEGTSRSKSVLDLFVASLEIHRQKLRENCERLIFADPLLYGRKAQELLWRKGYYETVSTAKRLRAGSKNCDELILSHINSGIGHYHNLISRIQMEMNMSMSELLDYPIVNNTLQDNVSENNKRNELHGWAKVSIQTCLVYLGDLCRYKTEYEDSGDNSMAVRYYLQAAGINPKNGMPYNQLGTLYTGKNYYLDSVRYYIVCLSCDNPFEGAEGNLLRVLDKNNKYLETSINKNNAVDQQESIKQFICKFLALIECCYFDKNPSSFNELCTDALYELKVCLLLRPISSPEPNMCHEEYLKCLQRQEINPDYLNSRILHKIVIISLLCINKFEKEDSDKALPLKAFVLAVLSQLLQKILNDFVEIGFNVQSPEEIVEERREKMKNYKNDYFKNNFKKSDKNIENSKELNDEISKEKSQEKSQEKITEDEQNCIKIQKDDNNDKTVKTKVKKNTALKIRRRKRRLTSETFDDGSESDDSMICSDLNESDSDNDVSEESYFTYSSSDDEDIEDNVTNEKSNSRTSSENDKTNPELVQNTESETNDKPEKEMIEFDEDKFSKFLEDDNLLVVSMLLNWLYVEDEFIISCRSTGQVLFQTLVNILNIVNRQIFPRLSRNTYITEQQYHQSLYKIHEVIMALKYKYKPIPLPEDYDMRSIPFLRGGLEDIKWDLHKHTHLTTRQVNGIRFLRMIDFGVYIVKLKFGIIFNRRLKMYTFKRNKPINKRSLIHPKKYPKEPKIPITKLTLNNDQNTPVSGSHEGLMRNMGKLWLSAQVQELESEVRAGKRQRGLPAYVVIDAEALSKYIHLVKRLFSIKKLVVLIPTIVLQIMDEMKKESGGARNAIRWLEYQLRNGSQYLRTQRSSENATIPSIKYPKKMPRDLLNFIQIIEFCHYFISQEGKVSINGDGIDSESSIKLTNGSEESGNDAALSEDNIEVKTSTKEIDNSNIVILLTGSKQLEAGECNELSRVDLAKSAGVSVENIHDFCAKMKNLFIKGGKNR